MEKSLVSEIQQVFDIKQTDIRTYSPLTLAYIGDGIYDLIIRTIIVEQGNAQVNKLHHRASELVKASAQKDLAHAIMELLSEEETTVFKRGRNAKSFTMAKNASVTDYRTATGLEALVGYLYLTEQTGRILFLMKEGLIRTGHIERQPED